jgi:hypothetical protein
VERRKWLEWLWVWRLRVDPVLNNDDPVLSRLTGW